MRRLPCLTALAIGLILLAGCGKDTGDGSETPVVGQRGGEERAAAQLGFPLFATKNTTRVGGGDAVASAAGVARAVYPGGSARQRPPAVVLAPQDDWRAALAASVFMAEPVGAPLLLAEDDELPPATSEALAVLDPAGSEAAGDAEVIRVGNVPRPTGRRSVEVSGSNPFSLAQAVDRAAASAGDGPSDRVLIVSSERPEFAMPAAGWAAKSGDPILFTTRNRLPPETRAAIATHQQPKIYVLGPSDVISPQVTRQLRRLGTVKRVGGQNPVDNAIGFARYIDGDFGWGVIDPGHGLVFAHADRELDAAAAAALSGSGKYGPLLLLEEEDAMPRSLEAYLLDIQPGYTEDPVRGVYNHAWLIGDEGAISASVGSRIDELLEIMPVSQEVEP